MAHFYVTQKVFGWLTCASGACTEHGDVEKIDLGNGRKLVIVRMKSPAATGKATQFAQNGVHSAPNISYSPLCGGRLRHDLRYGQ